MTEKKDPMAGVNIIKKLDDIPELKEKLIAVSETKSHKDVSRYAVLLGEHVLALAQMQADEAIQQCMDINRKWQAGEVRFQEARQVAFMIHRLAREEQDPVRVKVLRTMGQIAATPHVKRHGLVASDYAIKVVSLLFPKDFAEVEKERLVQIGLMESV